MLKGLQERGVGVGGGAGDDAGLVLSEALPDPLHGFQYLHQVYSAADPRYSGRVLVPVLWDRQTRTIVSNESSEILRMFNSGFGGLARNDVDLCPPALRWR